METRLHYPTPYLTTVSKIYCKIEQSLLHFGGYRFLLSPVAMIISPSITTERNRKGDLTFWFPDAGSLPERIFYKVTNLKELDHASSGALLF